jgi:hypothetical protein
MRSGIIGIIAAVIAMSTLLGCTGAPPETPGSINFYVHGRTELDVGASTR